ncbi:alpha/beta hydrolase fold domain-containing protein [Corynebacterium sp. 3HC-13]|uniref:alpha/beta hydrolase n=1 Tax=Corynebacterium poyangense TaxID=2684405 RepID=UPI001CCC7DF5|nr:alpha/beta hydrolase [Corynebacterium poyangense]MBZ8176882.1 alpha/beta hydrolase fold domain-containing protein [Corynebacterium poyangense]
MERRIAQDAWRALKPFRDAGSQSFESFPIPEVRKNYISSSSKNGLQDQDPEFTDYAVADFQVRVYEPRPAQHREEATPAILFFHGGGWLMGNLETHHSLVRRLSLLTGLPAVSVDYRLAPEHLYPAAIEDCREALRWLSDAQESHQLTVESVCLIGDSAGGQLTAILANEFSQDDSVADINSQVLLYPITDITTEGIERSASYQRITGGFPLTAHTMRWFIETYVPEGQDRSAADLSPLRAELPENLPPAYVVTVDNDPLADEGGQYALALAQHGCDVTYRHLAGYHHGLFTSAGVIPRGEEMTTEVAEFIRKHSGQKARTVKENHA